MDFVADHAVAIAAVIWGLALLVGIVVLVVAGVRLFLRGRDAQRRIQPPSEALMAAADATQARVDGLSRRSEDLSNATNELSVQVKLLGEIGRMGVDIAQSIRAPLRLLGR